MQYPLPLALFVVGICLFIVFYFVSKAFYYRRFETRYRFYQMFPYEFNYPNMFKQNLYGNLLFIMACISIIVFYEMNPYKSLYSYLSIAFAIVITMLMVVLLLFPLKYLRTHMIVSSIGMTISAALPVINLFTALSQLKLAIDGVDKALCIISMSLSLILALSMIALILNPKLSFNIYYDTTVDENGNEIKKRPRIIFMALNEWWSFFLFFLSPLSIVILLFI